MIYSLPSDLFWTLFLWLLSAGIGRKLLVKYLRFEFPSPWMGVIFSSGIGFAFYSYMTFAVGFLGGLYRPIFVWLFAVLFFWCFREIKELFSFFRRVPALIKEMVTDRFDVFLLVLLAAAIISNFLFCYSPPTQVREMLYDLNLPKMFLQEHRIYDASDRHLAYFPLQVQTLYLMALAVRGDLLAKLIHYLFGILSMGMLYLLAKQLFNKRAALFGAVIFYTMPMMTSLSSAANVDLGVLLFGLLTASSLIFWMQTGNVRHLYLAAFLAGVTSGTKVSGVAFALTLFVCAALWLFYIKDSFKPIVKKLCLMALFTLLGVSPWIFRNIYFAGNPFMPYAVPALGLKGHEAALMEINLCKEREKTLTLRDYLKGYHNVFFGRFVYGNGPLVFAFLLPAFFSGRARKNALLLFFIALINYIFLNTLLHYPHRFYETRYYVVSYSLWCILSGAGMELLLSNFWKPALLKIFSAAAILFPCLMFSLYMGIMRIPLFLGLETREDYKIKKLPTYPLAVFGNQVVPAEARILSVGGGDGHFYYWKARVIDPRLALLRERDKRKILSGLKQDGMTHILYFKNMFEYDKKSKIYKHMQLGDLDLYWNLNELAGKYFVELYSYNDTVLYRVDFPANLTVPSEQQPSGYLTF